MLSYKINSSDSRFSPLDNRLYCKVICQKPTDKNRKGEYNCFIDTGAVYIIITEKIIKELKLNCTNQETQTYALNITIDDVLFDFIECRKWEFEVQNHRITKPQPGLDILLGLNAISRKKLIIYPCDKNFCGSFEFSE